MSRIQFLRFLFALAAIALVSHSAIAQDVLNGIAAVVNDEVITFSQVRELVGAKEQAARQQLKGEELVEKVKEIRLQAINDLIDRQIARVHDRVEALRTLENQLLALRSACVLDVPSAACGIINDLLRASTGATCHCHAPSKAMPNANVVAQLPVFSAR